MSSHHQLNPNNLKRNEDPGPSKPPLDRHWPYDYAIMTTPYGRLPSGLPAMAPRPPSSCATPSDASLQLAPIMTEAFANAADAPLPLPTLPTFDDLVATLCPRATRFARFSLKWFLESLKSEPQTAEPSVLKPPPSAVGPDCFQLPRDGSYVSYWTRFPVPDNFSIQVIPPIPVFEASGFPTADERSASTLRDLGPTVQHTSQHDADTTELIQSPSIIQSNTYLGREGSPPNSEDRAKDERRSSLIWDCVNLRVDKVALCRGMPESSSQNVPRHYPKQDPIIRTVRTAQHQHRYEPYRKAQYVHNRERAVPGSENAGNPRFLQPPPKNLYSRLDENSATH